MVFTYSSFPTDSYNCHATRQTRTQPHANQHSRCFTIHVSSLANAPTTSITTSSGQSYPSRRTSWTFWRHGLRPEHHVRTDCTIRQFGQFPGQYLSLTKIALPILLTNFHGLCWLSYVSRILFMSYLDAWFLLLFGFHSAFGFSVYFDSVGFWPPQPWPLRLKKKLTLCQTDTSLEKLAPYLMKKLFIPLNVGKSPTHSQIEQLSYGSWKPIIEVTNIGAPWNDFLMTSPSAHWGLLPTTPWPAVLTWKLLPFNGVNITAFLIPFLMEAHRNSKNFDVMFYLNKSTLILPSKVHTHPSPTNNHCSGPAGDALHFATLKATLLWVYPFPIPSQCCIHHPQQPRRPLQDLWLRTPHLDANGWPSLRYLRPHRWAHLHIQMDNLRCSSIGKTEFAFFSQFQHLQLGSLWLYLSGQSGVLIFFILDHNFIATLFLFRSL